jgi:hypothetical protein
MFFTGIDQHKHSSVLTTVTASGERLGVGEECVHRAQGRRGVQPPLQRNAADEAEAGVVAPPGKPLRLTEGRLTSCA